MSIVIFSFERPAISVNTADRKSDNTIPIKTIVAEPMFLSTLAVNEAHTITAAIPNTVPIAASDSSLAIGNVMPKTVTMAAPSDAPDDTPSVYGEASGLCRTD